MKLPSVNAVPPSTHTVINDLTLSRALKQDFCWAGQLLMGNPNTFPVIRYDTTSWNKLGWRNRSQTCTWEKCLTCKCCGGRYLAAMRKSQL